MTALYHLAATHPQLFVVVWFALAGWYVGRDLTPALFPHTTRH